MIYFAQVKSSGKVKIGRSADPVRRVADLSSANPEPLVLLATMEACDQVETLLHRALNGPDSHREWHPLTPALEGILKACEAGIDLGPLLDSFVEVKSVKRKLKPKSLAERQRAREKPIPRKPRRMNLSDAERKRRSEAAKKRHREGRLGGAKYGKLGGRPKGS